MNDIKLQSPEGKHPLDENLRPLKVGTTTSPLELSKTDVKVKNLTVSGSTTGVTAEDTTKLPLAGGTMTDHITFASTKGIISSSFILNDSSNIELNADGGNVVIKDDTAFLARILSDGSKSVLYLYDPADSLDMATLAVADNAVTTLQTTGSFSAHLILDIQGDITLDSHTGNFIAMKAGTQFSAANSAYAGMILGYTDIGLNEGHTTLNLTTSYVVPTDEFSVSFVAPPSGNVEIFIQIFCSAGGTGSGDLYAGLSTANATSGYSALASYHEEILRDQSGRHGLDAVCKTWTLTGLTAGTSYEYWAGFKSTSTSGTPYISWGGNTSGRYPDFTMKATALPATITT